MRAGPMWSVVDDLRSYRVAAPPPPERFALRMGTSARLGLAVSIAAIALTVLVFVLTGQLFLLFVAAFGPGLYYVLAGAPRSLDVHHDAVIVRSWLRAPRRLPASELTVQRAPDVLVLASPDETLEIAADHFRGGAFERCAASLRSVAARFVEL